MIITFGLNGNSRRLEAAILPWKVSCWLLTECGDREDHHPLSGAPCRSGAWRICIWRSSPLSRLRALFKYPLVCRLIGDGRVRPLNKFLLLIVLKLSFYGKEKTPRWFCPEGGGLWSVIDQQWFHSSFWWYEIPEARQRVHEFTGFLQSGEFK